MPVIEWQCDQMSLEQHCNPVFAGHQTFHPRFGWLKKGFDAAYRDSEVFNREDAPVILGVGKNMVEAIRFWALATKVLVRQPHPTQKRGSICVPSALGEALLGEDGLDPYFEDPSTLWILHWQALAFDCMLPVWWATFNDLAAVEFTDDDLLTFCEEEVAATTWTQPKTASIKKDVDCLIRMYSTGQMRARQTIDDILDSPFRELSLITKSPQGAGSHRFVRGGKPGLSATVIVFACLDYLALFGAGARSISVSRLAADPGSPGRLLKLTEDVLIRAIEEVSAQSKDVSIAATAGAIQLVVEASPVDVARRLLVHHHELRGHVPLRPVHGAVAGPLARAADTRAPQKTPSRSRKVVMK